jgi:hypothetical protein
MTEHNDSVLSGGHHSARTDNDEDRERMSLLFLRFYFFVTFQKKLKNGQ